MDEFIGIVKIFAGNFAPRGWAFCQGQLLSIAQNTALFSILGTTYGGNGQTTFALPDLRSRVPVGVGQGPGLTNITQGEQSGAETQTLTISQMPAHTHTSVPVTIPANASDGTTAEPSATTVLGQPTGGNLYTQGPGTVQMATGGGGNGISGGSQPFPIRDPYLGMYYIICLEGIFPSRN